MTTEHRIDDSLAIAEFVQGGNAIFTIKSGSTGARFTYRVRVAKDNPDLFFVSVLTGPNNTADYEYAGIIRSGLFSHTRKSRFAADSPSVRAFAWFWNALTNALPSLASVEFFHMGRCARCARPLTTDSSVARGIGPECAQKTLFCEAA